MLQILIPAILSAVPMAVSSQPTTDALDALVAPTATSASEAESPAVAGWQTFPTRHQAERFALRMRASGWCTRVFYDARFNWWVCEWV